MTALAPFDTRTLIDDLLEEQQRLTAVERFARLHERDALPAQAKYYRALLPARDPAEGEQFAFAVDLDACTGCKGCVTACHNLNGLDEDEVWRNVGLLHGGTSDAPFQQTVTTACHHCVDPACMNGCPVLAYEKDGRTGIVRHLDDQCIGCQYCILKCPYDVPKYSPKRGIVRKCDMCSSRLAVGEAPACVQACPNEAIRISIVKKSDMVAEAARGSFLPGTPDPAYTIPTTRYHTKRVMPENTAPANRHEIKPEHAHPPLVVMLVLTQLSVGAFCVGTLLRLLFPTNVMTHLSPFHSLVAFALGVLAIGASTLHLGRPLYAWRAVAGLKTSWLSREIVVFGAFAGCAALDAGLYWIPRVPGFALLAAGGAASFTGLSGVFCSLMIYRDTRRPFWSGARTGLKFFGTCLLLGLAAILFVTTVQALAWPTLAASGAYRELTGWASLALATISTAKLASEAAVFRHLRDEPGTPMWRTACLISTGLAEMASVRFLTGVIGGVILPLTFLAKQPAPGFATLGITIWILIFALVGELIERYLFFVAVIPPKMPGGVGA